LLSCQVVILSRCFLRVASSRLKLFFKIGSVVWNLCKKVYFLFILFFLHCKDSKRKEDVWFKWVEVRKLLRVARMLSVIELYGWTLLQLLFFRLNSYGKFYAAFCSLAKRQIIIKNKKFNEEKEKNWTRNEITVCFNAIKWESNDNSLFFVSDSYRAFTFVRIASYFFLLSYL
jgi:hypothetical protein